MSRIPPNRHGELISHLSFRLRELQSSGIVSVITAVDTAENTRVVDVVWISSARHRANLSEYSYAVTPEICVEILVPANSLEEQMHKGRLCLRAGAEEFWLCDEHGSMQFFNAAGPLEHSVLCPGFPLRVEIPD